MADTRPAGPSGRRLEDRGRVGREIFRDSPLMTGARALLNALIDARSLAEEFADRDSNALAHRLLQAGFDFGDDEAQELLARADRVIGDVQGFLWSLNQIVALLEGEVPAAGKGRKSGAA